MPAVRITHELLARAAADASHVDEAVRLCGGDPTPGSRRYLRERMAAAGIDISHLRTGRVRHTEARLRAAVAESDSVKEVVRRLGISQVGGNQAHIGHRIAALGIDTSHFTSGAGRGPRRARGDLLALREPARGRVPGKRLRAALIAAGRAERCAMCGTGPEWNGRPLGLEVDHIDGAWWDNRAENLRLLCPNCHAVTDTYRGRRRSSR